MLPSLPLAAAPGMFVSESKFLSSPASFIPHILDPNPDALLGLITKPAVEAALLVRLGKKARWYGAELGPDGEPLGEGREAREKVSAEEVVRLYREYIIPLTKDVEVRFSLPCLLGHPAGQTFDPDPHPHPDPPHPHRSSTSCIASTG